MSAARSILGMSGETINGKPVADAMIEEWADEATVGYDVEKLR